MNIQLTFDYQTILRNESRPVHLVAKLTAQKLETHARPRSAAFAVVLDRSGSMSGKPLQLARESCATVVRNCVPTTFSAWLSSTIPHGFGDSYNEEILLAMSGVGHGQLHDADSADKFPAILAHELDGLQKITAQNVRLRVEPKLFCHSWAQYGDYPTVTLPDGRVEIALGDLVSEETREFVLLTEVLPLPLLPDGALPASLEGEELLGLEFVWTEICNSEIKSCQSTHLVRIQGTQNPEEVILNHQVVVVVANQIAGKAAREAAEKVREGDFGAAARSIRSASATLQSLAAPELTGEAKNLLDATGRRVDSENFSPRDLKNLSSESRKRTRTSSWTLDTRPRKKSKPKPKSTDKGPGRSPKK